MRASIDARGTLTVEAETPLEAYALDRWADNYFDTDEAADGKATLLISLKVRTSQQREKEEGMEHA